MCAYTYVRTYVHTYIHAMHLPGKFINIYMLHYLLVLSLHFFFLSCSKRRVRSSKSTSPPPPPSDEEEAEFSGMLLLGTEGRLKS